MLTLYPLSFFLCAGGLSSALVCTFIPPLGASITCMDGYILIVDLHVARVIVFKRIVSLKSLKRIWAFAF